MKHTKFNCFFLIVLALAFLTVSCKSTPKSYSELFIEKELNNTAAPLAKLDFSPFEKALSALTGKRRSELNSLIMDKSIKEIQLEIEKEQLTYEELVLFYIDRIKTYRYLNAYIELNPNALKDAQKRDEERRTIKNSHPIFGIPVALKDNIGTKLPLHTTAGAAVLENSYTPEDSDVVKSLLQKGAVLLGKTNLSEWAGFLSTELPMGYSALGGQTRNPYGPFSVNGSSSGSAVAVAADLAAVSIGTETAGSLVSPARQASILALKPSLGIVSGERIVPITTAQDTAGPMARNPEDLTILMDAISTAGPPEAPPENRIKLAVYNGQSSLVLYDDTVLLDEFVNKIASDSGIEIVNPEIDPNKYGLNAGDGMEITFKRDLRNYLQGQRGSDAKSLSDIIEFNKKNPKAYILFGQSLLIKANKNKAFEEKDIPAVNAKNRALAQKTLDDIFERSQADAILTQASNSLTNVYATAGYPALSFPVHYTKAGEPYGFILIGKKDSDPKLLQIAYKLEASGYMRRERPALKADGVR